MKKFRTSNDKNEKKSQSYGKNRKVFKHVHELGKFRGSIALTDKSGPQHSTTSRWHDQSLLQVLPRRLQKGKLTALKKETESQQSQCTDAVIQSNTSVAVAETVQHHYVNRNLLSKLSHLELNCESIEQNKIFSLKERRAIFQRKQIHSIFSSDLDSDVSISDSADPIINSRFQNQNQQQNINKTARHISVHKFDTFSTFEGTFDEGTGLGYLTGIEEDHTESFEKVIMSASNMSKEQMTSQDTNDVGNTVKKEHLFKILVIGELGTGKTSIIKRYVHQFFSQHYRATIGVDFALKVLNWDSETIIRLQLWDIAGQERFGNMTRVYYKEAVGAFIVFDVTRTSTLEAVVKWKQDLDQKVQLPDGTSIPCVLLANKCDQQKEGLVTSPTKMEEYCQEKNFSGWFETSAKENINIEEAANFLVHKILDNEQLRKDDHSEEKLDNEKLTLQNLEAKQKMCAC